MAFPVKKNISTVPFKSAMRTKQKAFSNGPEAMFSEGATYTKLATASKEDMHGQAQTATTRTNNATCVKFFS